MKNLKSCQTDLGRIVYFTFSDFVQFRNITNGDIMWTIWPKADFNAVYRASPIEIFTSERINKLKRIASFKVNGVTYGIADKDDHYYVIDISLLRAYPRSKYPDMKFIYARVNKLAAKRLDFDELERLYFEKIRQFNGSNSFDIHLASRTIEEIKRVAAVVAG